MCLTVADDGDWRGDAEEGTGLSIVRALVHDELTGSSPSVATEAGYGPRCASRPRLFGVRILVAEDETIIRLDLRKTLEDAGFEVCAEARNGEEAVALAASERPDLAILDVKMPQLDGIEAARRILADRPIPIVMLTAYDQEELVSRAVEAGVFGYLVKPFRESDLLPAIGAARARHAELEALGRRPSRSRRRSRRARSSNGRRGCSWNARASPSRRRSRACVGRASRRTAR